MLLLMNKGFRWPEKRTPHYGDPTLKKKKKKKKVTFNDDNLHPR